MTIFVATNIFGKKSAHIGTGSGQELRKRPQPVSSQVPQLLAVDLLNRLIQTGQKLESLGSDLSNYCSAVLGVTETRDQATFFQAVEQARDIRIPSNHAAGNFSARQAVRRSPQNAEHVVLCRRDILRFQNLGQTSRQQVTGTQQVHERSLF